MGPILAIKATYAEPSCGVGIGRETGAASKLLVTSGANDNGILHRAETAGVQRAHVEDVHALHLSENLETLETGSLLEIGGDGAGSSAGTEEIFIALDLYSKR